MKAKEIKAANFETEVTGTEGVVLVDFHAEWCGPCKLLGPVIDQVAEEQDGRAVVAKFNIDESTEIASRYQVTSIPTLMAFRDGEPVGILHGVQSKAAIEELIETASLN